MKKVEAIFRHTKLQDVKDALVQIGVEGMTVTEVLGRGHKRGATIQYRGVTSQQEFVPNVKIETIVTDDEAEAVIDAIFQSAHTGEIGDGRIIVTEVESVMRIRTGEVADTDAEIVRHRRESRAVPPCVRAGPCIPFRQLAVGTTDQSLGLDTFLILVMALLTPRLCGNRYDYSWRTMSQAP